MNKIIDNTKGFITMYLSLLCGFFTRFVITQKNAVCVASLCIFIQMAIKEQHFFLSTPLHLTEISTRWNTYIAKTYFLDNNIRHHPIKFWDSSPGLRMTTDRNDIPPPLSPPRAFDRVKFWSIFGLNSVIDFSRFNRTPIVTQSIPDSYPINTARDCQR